MRPPPGHRPPDGAGAPKGTRPGPESPTGARPSPRVAAGVLDGRIGGTRDFSRAVS